MWNVAIRKRRREKHFIQRLEREFRKTFIRITELVRIKRKGEKDWYNKGSNIDRKNQNCFVNVDLF